jgi:hypothetical protein
MPRNRVFAAATHDLRQPVQTLALSVSYWRKLSRRKNRNWSHGSTRQWAHVGHAERSARHKPDRGRHCSRRLGRFSHQRSTRPAEG